MTSAEYIVPVGIERTFPPGTEGEIREAEQSLGQAFPEDYRDFLRSVNGIQSHSATSSVNMEVAMKTRTGQEDEPWGINMLYTLCKSAEPHCQLLTHQRAYGFDQRVPRRYIIIGCTFGMDQLCLSLAAPDCGQVYFWCPGDFPPGPYEPTTKKLWPVAKSFREFWSLLRVAPDDE